MKNKKKKTGFYFDDCEICQAQKKADQRGKNMTLREIEEAFRKQQITKKPCILKFQ